MMKSLDFYLPNENITIECQGKQHFGEGFNHCKRFDFDKIKEYDERKRNLCENNGIELIYFLNEKYNEHIKCLKNKYFNDVNDIINYIKK